MEENLRQSLIKDDVRTRASNLQFPDYRKKLRNL